jgi:holliday junction DNA helicase RuvA
VIGRLPGVLLEKKAPEILVDVHGVAYEVQAPMSTFYQLPPVGDAVSLFTHFVVREDAQLLFGFYQEQERVLFRNLIRVNGVGPKMALAILSGMAADDFVRTVLSNDISALVRMPGVGRKTAERLIIEMRDRLKDWHSEDALDTVLPSGASVAGERQVSADAETALIALGYKPQEASRMIAQALKNKDNVSSSEELIRLALRSMA